MSRRSAKSPTASVVAQSRAKGHADNKKTVTPLTDRERQHTRIDCTADPSTGAPRLRVVIPGGAEPEIYDFSKFLHHEEIAHLVAEGFRIWAPGRRSRTRDELHRSLLLGLANHLTSLPPNAPALEQIDEAFWTSFLRYLDAPRHSGKPWEHSVRRRRFGVFITCVSALEDHSHWAKTAKRLLYYSGMPRNPWPGSSRKNRPTKIIAPHDVDRILAACIAEVKEIQKRIERNAKLIELGLVELDSARSAGSAPDYTQLSVCAARVDEAFPQQLASLTDLISLDTQFGRAAQRHGIAAVREMLYNSFEDLVPFVVLIGFKTIFNPDALLSLEREAIKSSFEDGVIIFHADKPRSNRVQTSTHRENESVMFRLPAEEGTPLGLKDLLDTLERLTARTRNILKDSAHRSRLFIAAPNGGTSVAKAFQSSTGPASDTAWRYALGCFINRHRLPRFTLKMIRATGADETRRVHGIFAQQERQGHSSPKTTRTFYTSDWVRKQGQDRIGEAQELYVRMAETHGRIDPRGLGAGGRQAAATPGFLCLDPYASPLPGQVQNKLCAAYGECPACPLAAAYPKADEEVAWYLALREAILDAQRGRVSAVHWREKWEPVLRDLDALLKLVPRSVENAARRYRISLPPVS